MLREGDRLYVGEENHRRCTLDPVRPDDAVIFWLLEPAKQPHVITMLWELLRRSHQGRIPASRPAVSAMARIWPIRARTPMKLMRGIPTMRIYEPDDAACWDARIKSIFRILLIAGSWRAKLGQPLRIQIGRIFFHFAAIQR